MAKRKKKPRRRARKTGEIADMSAPDEAREPVKTSTKKVRLGEIVKVESALKAAGATPYNPDEFLRRKGSRTKVYARLLAEPMINASIQRKVYDVVQRNWIIQPADETPEQKQVARDVDYIFRNYATPTSAEQGPFVIGGDFRHCLHELMYAPVAGHAIVETAPQLFSWGPLKGKIGLYSTKGKDPDEFRLMNDGFGNVTAVRRLRDQEDFPWDNFLLFPFAGWLANAWGVSDLRSVYRAQWLKANMWIFISIFCERWGTAFPQLKTTAEPSEDQKTEARAILKALRTDAGFLLPEGFEVEFITIATQGVDAMDRFIERLDREILTGILGASHQMLVAEKGARSLAEVHADVADLFVGFAASSVQNVITNQLIPRVVDWNWEVEAYPTFVFQEAIDLKETAEIDIMLSQLGHEFPVDYVPDTFGRPKAKDGEKVLVPPVASPGGPGSLGFPIIPGVGAAGFSGGEGSPGPFFGAYRQSGRRKTRPRSSRGPAARG